MLSFNMPFSQFSECCSLVKSFFNLRNELFNLHHLKFVKPDKLFVINLHGL